MLLNFVGRSWHLSNVGENIRHAPSWTRRALPLQKTICLIPRLPSAGPVVSWVLGDGAARTAAAGRMLTRRDVNLTAVMLASAWYGLEMDVLVVKRLVVGAKCGRMSIAQYYLVSRMARVELQRRVEL